MGVNINTKPTVTTIDNNDQIFISDDGVALKKISYTDLAKAIIEQYNASQLAGSTKTVQTAINALNSNITPSVITITPGENVSWLAGTPKKIGSMVYINGVIKFLEQLAVGDTILQSSERASNRYDFQLYNIKGSSFKLCRIAANSSTIMADTSIPAGEYRISAIYITP